MIIFCENINVKVLIYVCNNGFDFKSLIIFFLFIICVFDVFFFDMLFGKKNRDMIVLRVIKIEIVMKIYFMLVVVFIILLKVGFMIVVVLIVVLDRVIVFFCFFVFVCFDKNVKVVGIKKLLLNLCIKCIINSCLLF